MSDDTQQPIVVRRVKKGGGGHHGGAWKIAYADFVTAMMAFFLLMWLLGSTAQGDLQGIAEHFQSPFALPLQGGSGSGDSSSILRGGGEDLSRSVGQVRRGEIESRARLNVETARAGDSQTQRQEEARERALLVGLMDELEELLAVNSDLFAYSDQILMDITADGLRIQMVDKYNRPMFASASADLEPYSRSLLRAIGAALNGVPNRLKLTGHTDALPFPGGERAFSNWELSANRANASRREMIAGGLEPNRVSRVVGLADTVPLIEDDPFHPANRRISIVVLTKRAEDALRSRDTSATLPSAEDQSSLDL